MKFEKTKREEYVEMGYKKEEEIARLNYNSGMAEAKKSGIAEERKRNIRKMKSLGINDKQICDILNLTKAELEKLIED